MTRECGAVGELIPWVVNGTAEAAEAQQVYAHLVTCAACRQDFAQAAALRRELAESSAAPVAPPPLAYRVATLLLGRQSWVAELLRRALSPTTLRPRLQVRLPFVAPVVLGAGRTARG